MDVVLRLTGKQHAILKSHLYPGDGLEAAAIALCGRGGGLSRHCLSVYKILAIPYSACIRKSGYLHWPTESAMPLVEEAASKGMAILKIHSHPSGFNRFSPTDTEADTELFSSVHGWVDDGLPHASAVMLPDGRIFGRSISVEGKMIPLPNVLVAGDDICIWPDDSHDEGIPATMLRNRQAFGSGTINLLRHLRIAVVGCSGTGSIVIEQLARLGVGHLVMVDPDVIEGKNVNRVLNTTTRQADIKISKVDALRGAVHEMGLGTKVTALPSTLFNAEAIHHVTECDILFGCMDSVDGRDLLNRIGTFYNIPYFDLGVRLDADGKGGVNQICGTVHYLQPDGSSLLSRGVYTPEDLAAAGLRRVDPAAYENLRREMYIKGVEEDRPAVISVNMLIAALAVSELLARIHPFRDDPNGNFASFGISLTQSRIITACDGQPCEALAKYAGRGNLNPLLNLPELSAGFG